MLGHSVLVFLTLAKSAIRRAAGGSGWRVDFARMFYYRNRVRYDARLLLNEKWRRFALRDNWLSDSAGAIDATR